jgi:hypothetical protein
MSALAQGVAEFVARSRAGDQNATATIRRVGEEARRGNPRARTAYAAFQAYIHSHPASDFVLGTESPLVASQGGESVAVPVTAIVEHRDPEMRKPVLPRGAFDQLFNPQAFVLVVLNACRFRHGLDAASVVLAAGPPIKDSTVKNIAESNFGSAESRRAFVNGVRFSDDNAWREMSVGLEPSLKRCLVIGQCVGRARRIQAVRMPRSRIGEYSEVAGWEFGE